MIELVMPISGTNIIKQLHQALQKVFSLALQYSDLFIGLSQVAFIHIGSLCLFIHMINFQCHD